MFLSIISIVLNFEWTMNTIFSLHRTQSRSRLLTNVAVADKIQKYNAIVYLGAFITLKCGFKNVRVHARAALDPWRTALLGEWCCWKYAQHAIVRFLICNIKWYLRECFPFLHPDEPWAVNHCHCQPPDEAPSQYVINYVALLEIGPLIAIQSFCVSHVSCWFGYSKTIIISNT